MKITVETTGDDIKTLGELEEFVATALAAGASSTDAIDVELVWVQGDVYVNRVKVAHEVTTQDEWTQRAARAARFDDGPQDAPR